MTSTFPPAAARLHGLRRVGGCAVLLAGALSGCATSPSTPAANGTNTGSRVVTVVAAENFWGSLVEQLGGAHVKVTSIIDNPDADPHDYEPTAADARAMAAAGLAVVNGVGYDAWAGKLIAANPAEQRIVLSIGELVGVNDGGNPHRWYNPDDVRKVIDQITADLKKADPADAAFFDKQHDLVLNTYLKPYFDVIAEIKATYAGTPVGASESIFSMIAPATGLSLVTPEGFLTAITEGSDPTPRDKATIDAQIKGKQIKVYVYNSQNATPDVQAQVTAAKKQGIPVVTITETLSPAGASFQDWQAAQLTSLKQALATAAGE